MKSSINNASIFNLKHLLFSIFLVTSFSSCTKSAGIGGQAIIKGNIIVNNIDDNGDTIVSYGAQDLDVFIIYGNEDNIQDDDTKTSHDGSFEFKYLNPGDYSIYVFSDCEDCHNGQDSLVLINTTIVNRKDTNDLGTIYIANYL